MAAFHRRHAFERGAQGCCMDAWEEAVICVHRVLIVERSLSRVPQPVALICYG